MSFPRMGLRFHRWIHPSSSAQHKWILTTTKYFSKWVEVIPTKSATDVVVIKFLEENILARYGCPRKIIANNAQAFNSISMNFFCQK